MRSAESKFSFVTYNTVTCRSLLVSVASNLFGASGHLIGVATNRDERPLFFDLSGGRYC
jgi:hypothetical protein